MLWRRQSHDQVINKCLSHELRRKLLQEGQALTLQRLREIACPMEESEKKAHLIEGASDASNEGNSVGGKVDHKEDLSARNVKCFCCRSVEHKANNHRFAARGKRCRKCNGTGHFEALCKMKREQNSGLDQGVGGRCGAGNGRRSGGHHHIRQVEQPMTPSLSSFA